MHDFRSISARLCDSKATIRSRWDNRGMPEAQPLAARMRPKDLDEYVGQEHLVGKGRVLRRRGRGTAAFDDPLGAAGHRQDDARRGSSPRARSRTFVAVSRRVGRRRRPAQGRRGSARAAAGARGGRTVLFIDEIHRFNKAQQDAILPFVEDGDDHADRRDDREPVVRGQSARCSRGRASSRCKQLEPDETSSASCRARWPTPSAVSATLGVALDDEALERARRRSVGGDARIALNALEARRARRERRDGRQAHRSASSDVEEALQHRDLPLRPAGRRALRHDLGLHQVAARLRSRRRALLARAHDRGGRGPAVHRRAAW